MAFLASPAIKAGDIGALYHQNHSKILDLLLEYLKSID